MQIVPLQNIPNQEFTIVLNNSAYRIALRSLQAFTYVSVWQDGELLFYNQICTPNNWVNPYNYVSTNGKLYFKCLDNDYPTYTKFGDTQQMIFYAPDEIAGV